MAANTTNVYGRISISDEAVANMANHVASECYGVVELVSTRFTDSIATLFNKHSRSKGIKVSTFNNMIYIDVYVILKHGVKVSEVEASLRGAIKYGVESFTGMIVKNIEVHIVGMRV